MRPIPLSLLAALIVAAPAPAQDLSFQGSVDFLTARGSSMVYSAGSGMVRIDVAAQRGSVTTLFDNSKKLLTILLPDQKMYMQRPMPESKSDPKADSDTKVTNTGKTDVVAGVKCEIWHAESKRGSFDVCAARDMGGFFAGMGMRREQPPEWAKSLQGKFFPLRVLDTKGDTLLLATKVERKKFEPSYFAIPEGFAKMDVPHMPGMEPPEDH